MKLVKKFENKNCYGKLKNTIIYYNQNRNKKF